MAGYIYRRPILRLSVVKIDMEKEFEPWCELDKIVMITGASSGLGWEFSLDLAKAGCRIIAVARHTDRLKALCDEINHEFLLTSNSPSQAQPRAVAIELDISTSESVIATQVKKAWDVFGRMMLWLTTPV